MGYTRRQFFFLENDFWAAGGEMVVWQLTFCSL
jgi:hypothetical protein